MNPISYIMSCYNNEITCSFSTMALVVGGIAFVILLIVFLLMVLIEKKKEHQNE